MKTRTQSFLIKAVLSILCISMLTLGFLTLGSKNIAFANSTANVISTGEDNYVAEVNGAKFADLQTAIDSASEGDTVTLLSDVVYSDTDSFEKDAVVIDKSITLDLGDYYIRNTIESATPLFPNNGFGDPVYPAGLYVRNGSIGTQGNPGYINVVINATNGGIVVEGNGKVAIMSGNIELTDEEKVEEKDASDYRYTNLTINGGNYLGDRYAVFHNNGLLTINDGKFQDVYQDDGPQHCIYSHRYDYFFGDFIINGGSFKNFNPACAFMHAGEPYDKTLPVENWHGYVAEGKTGVLGDDGWYTVADGERVVQRTLPSRIDSSFICHCYASIQDAIEAGESDVSLIVDTNENFVYDRTEGSSFTFNLGEFTYNGTITIVQDTQLTIKGTSDGNNIVLTDPLKDHHTFLGWYSDADFAEGTLLDNNTITSVTESGTTYYAKWKESEYDKIPEFDEINPNNDRTLDFGSIVYGESVPNAQSLTFGYDGSDKQNAKIVKIDQHPYFETSFDADKLTATIAPKSNIYIPAGTYEEFIHVTMHDRSTHTIIAKLVVNKAKVEKPTADTSVFTYTGTEQTYNVTESTLYTISDNTRTNAGSQTVTVSLNDAANYEWTDETTTNITFTFKIGKASAVINVDTTAIVKTYGESFTLPVATTNFGEVICDKTITDLVNANTYTVTYTVAETDNYNGDTKTVSVTINKATYDMSGITFANKTVKHDGQAQSIEISGTLPNGVAVEYANNGKTDVGVYTITANFVYDTVNYNEIQSMTATLTINKAEMVSGLVDENGKPVVIITSVNGFAPNVENTITEIAIDNVQTGESVKENEKVASVIDITLTENGNAVQPTENITIKLLIPTELKDKEFRLVHSHEGTFTDIEYTVDGDYVVFTTDNLSEFLFVYDDTANLGWLIGLLAGVATLTIASGIILYVKLKKKQEKNNTRVK